MRGKQVAQQSRSVIESCDCEDEMAQRATQMTCTGVLAWPPQHQCLCVGGRPGKHAWPLSRAYRAGPPCTMLPVRHRAPALVLSPTDSWEAATTSLATPQEMPCLAPCHSLLKHLWHTHPTTCSSMYSKDPTSVCSSESEI